MTRTITIKPDGTITIEERDDAPRPEVVPFGPSLLPMPAEWSISPGWVPPTTPSAPGWPWGWEIWCTGGAS